MTDSMDDEEALTLWLGAARYYLGRMSYAVSDFCDLLRRTWPRLPARVRLLIRRDVEERIAADDAARGDGRSAMTLPLGMDCDREQWQRVRALWADECPRCAGRMSPGVALASTAVGRADFPGGDVITVSPGGPGKVVACFKCEACGHSTTG